MMRILTLLMLSLLLIACGQDKAPSPTVAFVGSDVSDVTLTSDFVLSDHNGQPRKLADFQGKVVALFFGYTHCPDVCPTTLYDLAQAVKQMGDQGKQVQVLFITLDSPRDTQELLGKYVPSFHPDFLGLRGDEASTIKVTQDFKVYYVKQESKSRAGYIIDHTAGVYVFDKTGKLRVIMKNGQSSKDMAHDLGLLI